MFQYHVKLALHSFKGNKVLTALMVLAIAMGIGASMTTLTAYYALSANPLPGRSHIIYYPQLDPAPMKGYSPGAEPATQMTRLDAEALLRERRADRQAVMTGGHVAIDPQGQATVPFYASARYTSADFFLMFDVPMIHGNAWQQKEDDERGRVVVISKSFNDQLFGGGNSVGKTLRLDQRDFLIVGVMDHWRPVPRFYDLSLSHYGKPEQVFLPFSTSRELKLPHRGVMDCWGSSGGEQTDANAPCTWVQFWVQLDTPQKATAYREFLQSYSELQRRAGRYERPANTRLRNVEEWLDINRVVPSDVRLQTWLALGFLLVCMLNTVGLLLAKFLGRSGEVSVRRALGASRRAIFSQYLVEAGAIGLAGGFLGLLLTLFGLWILRQQPNGHADLVNIDLPMLVMNFVLALAVSVVAGLLPAWRACVVEPSIELKSQ